MSNVDITSKLTGLVPFEKYDYFFEGMGGNWPCIITPYSGTIRPYSDTVNLDAVVHFCTTKTSCPSGSVGLLPYTTGLCDPNPNLFTTIRLVLKPETLGFNLHSDAKTVTCASCFDQPVITTPSTITLTSSAGNEYTMTTSIVGLQANQEYTYTVSSIEGNWPIKVTPASGTIKVSKDRITLTNQLMFCKNTGLCPSSDANVMDYSPEAACLATDRNYFNILQLSLNNEDCNIGSVISNPIPIYCRDCLPKVGVKLGTSDTVTLNETQNTNGFALQPSVSGLQTDRQYSYVFKSLTSNWPVYISPVSGVFKPNSPTSAPINSQLFFCANTGICPTGTKGVLNYSLDPIPSHKMKNDTFVNLQLELTDESCSQVYKSNSLLVYCDNCIPQQNIRVVSNTIT